MKNTIKINGTEFRVSPNGLGVIREPIWSKNTGRGSDGTMLGDIVAFKHKISVSFPPMSDAEAVQFSNAIAQAFFNVEFHDPYSNKTISKTMYAGESSGFNPYGSLDIFSKIRYQGVTLNLIEQ